MKTKKITKLLALSVLGVLALTACDEVIAEPQDYEEPLVVLPTDFQEEIHNNVASVVYDSIHSSGIGGDVLDQVLYLYAVSTFGAYNGKVIVNNQEVSQMEGTITLKNAVLDPDTKVMDTFVLQHKAYWDEGRADISTPVTDSERERVEAKYNTIEDRIAEQMYNKISGGTYTDRHKFSETRFLKSLRGSLESVSDPSEVTPYEDTQILPSVEPEQVFGNYLHREFYDSDDNGYIAQKIVPSIYRQLLAEQYLIEETYNTLGRSYARKVNIVKITNNENKPSVAYSLAKELVDEINASPEEYKEGRIAKYGLLNRFKEYSNAQVGVIGRFGDLSAILTKAGLKAFDYETAQTQYGWEDSFREELENDLSTFFPGTSYGDLADKYVKMKDVKSNGISSDLESTFTNSGAYPTYVGLEEQKASLMENDNTTTGWYIKNGGLTDLPDSIRSRLFNIGVATGVKEKDPDDYAREYVNGDWVAPANESSYVCRINGHNYLKTASRVKGDPIKNDILHYDSTNKCYYIVEIEQAVSSSKLSKNGERNYAHTLGDEAMQTIINEVAKIVGQGESYSTLATKKYLKKMEIEYHDESVYDYFKTNYPELFDDDADSSSDDSASTDTSATA